MWKKAKHRFRSKLGREGPLQRARYDPALETKGTDKDAMDTAVQMSRRYFQLKTGHVIRGAYLRCIG